MRTVLVVVLSCIIWVVGAGIASAADTSPCNCVKSGVDSGYSGGCGLGKYCSGDCNGWGWQKGCMAYGNSCGSHKACGSCHSGCSSCGSHAGNSCGRSSCGSCGHSSCGACGQSGYSSCGSYHNWSGCGTSCSSSTYNADDWIS